MKELRIRFYLIVLIVHVVYGNTKNENEFLLKRFRRIIRGHLAQPGQVIVIEIICAFILFSIHLVSLSSID